MRNSRATMGAAFAARRRDGHPLRRLVAGAGLAGLEEVVGAGLDVDVRVSLVRLEGKLSDLGGHTELAE
jgi:hypothetical protein